MSWGEPARAREVRLLGPLEVTVAGQAVDVTAGRPRALLAALGLSAGRAVPAERLAAVVWGERPPDNVVRSVQTYVSRLRALLGPDAIGTTTVGYQLRVDPDAVDALRFVRLLDAAAAHAADHRAERALLGQALSLWRGAPFQGIRSEFLARSEAPRLVERYLAALERRIDLDMSAGRHGDLVAELIELTGRYPLREPLWVRLLDALDRSGRQAEALDRFELIRRRLAEELGVDPGPELRRMHAGLLAGATPGWADETRGRQQPARTGGTAPAAADVHRLYDLIDRARAVTDDRATALLFDAVLCWRKWLVADSDAGAGADLDPRTDDLTALSAALDARARAQPLDEPLLALLMLVLYRRGRHADALERYERFRQRLADAGGEPAAAVQRLHQHILVADLAQSPPLRLVPHQLPAPPTTFVGRAAELAELHRLRHSGACLVVAVDGMAGVGKTAFAVHAAHGLADRYPDGEIFLDLRGHSPAGHPVEAADALGRVLRALGIPGEQIPQDADERAALYRSRLAGRRMVILLDNAATEPQVRPLLPGATECLVLVTSRRRLVGLDPTRTVSLGALPLPDAAALLVRAAGEDRLGGEPDELVRDVVELCGRLPLAIRVAAARLDAHPTWTLRHLLDRLRLAHEAGLAEFDAGERGVAAALDLSYRQLTPDQARGYRLLGLHPGRDFDPYAASALVDTTLAGARRLIDHLHDVHMLQESAPDRYLFHDLVGVHAAHRAATTDPEPVRRAALGRLLDYYSAAATSANTTAYPHERPPGPRTVPADRPVPELRAPGHAVAWLDDQLANLLAGARHAAEHGWPGYALRLARSLHRHLATRGQYRDAELVHGRALAAARATGDRLGELDLLNRLGEIRRLQRRHELASGAFEQALDLARATGDAAGEQEALIGLGDTDRLRGRPRPAADAYERVLAIARRRGDRLGELRTRYGLGWTHLVQGRLDPAVAHFGQALAIARATRNRPGELDALVSLGHARQLQGNHRVARHELERALTVARAIGHRSGELAALATLGHLYRSLGQAEEAAVVFERTLAIATEWGNRNWQFEALFGLGRLEHAAGRPEDAVRRHRDALRLAREMAQPVDLARSHDRLAHAYRASGRDELARRHWQQALDILTGLGIEQAEDDTSVSAIRAQLA